MNEPGITVYQPGILDKTRLLSNILMLLLLIGNVYFSTNFIQNITKTDVVNTENTTLQIKSARALKDFINMVLTKPEVSFEDRVTLENDILQIHDPVLTSVWNDFVNSKTSKEGQDNAVKLMTLLVDRV